MQRIGLKLQVRPERLDEYKQLHNPIPADLAQALRDAGIRNYSLWLDEATCTEFGYLECDDCEKACASLATNDAHTRWQNRMQGFLRSPTDASLGGQPVTMLEQVFLLV